ncbi:hypothetical protein [Aliiglaciecola lipolytica]|uniref:Uncharacterized protein n=1 Tax=Aliiglaciecola lipolytica E3 TaxID=1127673 RepID=K6YJA6_9ALTE|nr:hypothetical protein [Aliiglaciecola lipolytica]GAC16693.1 hypothetical protein GLIP_4082 [Aliiglaciecola lipolytica E3]
MAGDIGAMQLHGTLDKIEIEAKTQNLAAIELLLPQAEKQYEALITVLKGNLKPT